MAILNEIMVGRYNRHIQKLLGLKGPAALNQVSSEMQVSHNVFNGVENRFTEGWDRFGVAVNIVVAAAQGAIRLRNPVASNVVAVVERCTVSVSVANTVAVQTGAATTDYGTLATAQFLDARQRPFSTCTISSILAAATSVGTSFWLNPCSAAAPVEVMNHEHHHIALAPGQGIQMLSLVATGTYFLSLVWRERYLEESERA